ncbi:thiol:disulfide interchange protein DsbA/DsbL [Thiopseudomonas denitrificans]|uniref:Thiol:disulfide interchange protein n=1 Tax=Thiopseudomonas denitrificans TaxID=1501432 RepID=A0A4R6U150_9GAMM|nr:thiol:disulfide interchange protein DsbA/DsbL [Thiopseudomonas denitrificans]TDQ38119.1 thiol:disulfide interchange protein DsbA [Thiopseudomonas denitrificans]
MRKLLLTALLSLGGLALNTAMANNLVAGQHYAVLANPVTTSQADKIEVVELFWYGCPHCYQLEPTISSWKKELPEDVNFVKIPAMFGGIWNLHGQLYYSLQALKVDDSVHDAVFEALHERNRRLASLPEITAFVGGLGIDKDAFEKAWNSFGVKSQLEKAKKLAIAYQVSGVPALVVNGKYRFDIGMAGGLRETAQVADLLIEKERGAR